MALQKQEIFVMAHSPQPRVQRPALMLLTSHRMDCFELCVWCLERFTDLERFRAVYILANAVSPEHQAVIDAFAARHAQVRVIPCLPRGLLPAVMEAQNAILARHADDGVVKIDEDVFVTPHWLDHLLAAHRLHRDNPDVLLAGCPTPVSSTGKRCLHGFFRACYPDIAKACGASAVHDDPVYHRMVWEAVLTQGMMQRYAQFANAPYFYPESLIIQCVLYDRRALEAIGPFPVSPVRGTMVTDEVAVNMALRRTGSRAVLPAAGLVHHYSHAACLPAMLRAVPVARIRDWMRVAYAPAR